MNNKIILGSFTITAGILIAFGPQFLFKVCKSMDYFMKCHWTAQVEIGVGAVIAAMGIAIIVFNCEKIRLGLCIGLFLSGTLSLLLPHVLIGMCSMDSMPCRKITLPAITVIDILLLIDIILNIVYLKRRKEK